MDAVAKITSKGQLTIPKSVRDALELHAGDSVVMALDNGQVILRKIPNLLDLAGSVPVPSDVRGADWERIRRETRLRRGRAWR